MSLLASALCVYGLYLLVLFLFQRQMMYPRYLIAGAPAAPRDAGIAVEWIETSFGKVESWFLPPAPEAARPAPAVIVAHGNAERIDFLPPEFSPFRRMGFAVFLVEYPGYGRSQGAPSQRSIAEVFDKAYDRLASREGIDKDRIVLFGRSLGGGAVCDLSLRRPVSALILVSSFTSARSFARRYLAPGFLVRDPFDNLSALRRYSGPVLIVHGRRDDVVPFVHAARLAEAAPRADRMFLECGHNDCPPDPDVFWKRIAAFLQEAGALP